MEYANLWKPVGVNGIELFDANLHQHSFSKHMHSTYTIVINYAGYGFYLSKGGKQMMFPGTIDILNPEKVHTGQPDLKKGWIYRSIYVEKFLIQEVIKEMTSFDTGIPVFPGTVVSDKKLFILTDEVIKVFNGQNSSLEKETLTLQFLTELITKYASRSYDVKSVGKEPYAVSFIKNYLEAHYAEDVSLGELVKYTGLSPYYLIRSFNKFVGLPPHTYQRNLRLLKAKQAILTPKPLIDIAVEHGFFDQSHFNRHFKNMFGVTPGQYRKCNSIQDN